MKSSFWRGKSLFCRLQASSSLQPQTRFLLHECVLWSPQQGSKAQCPLPSRRKRRTHTTMALTGDAAFNWDRNCLICIPEQANKQKPALNSSAGWVVKGWLRCQPHSNHEEKSFAKAKKESSICLLSLASLLKNTNQLPERQQAFWWGSSFPPCFCLFVENTLILQEALTNATGDQLC